MVILDDKVLNFVDNVVDNAQESSYPAITGIISAISDGI
jgi:hypothetical protein